MRSNPRWIAEHKIEAPGRRHLREMRREGERKRTTIAEASERRACRPERLAHRVERAAGGRIGNARRLEEIGGARREQELPPLGGETLHPLRCSDDGTLPFGAVERASQRTLADTVRSRVPQAQGCEARTVGDCSVAEAESGECVSFAHVAVEIGQGREPHGVVAVVLHHDGEPEAKLAEPDRRGIDVDAEDRAGEHVATHGDQRAHVPPCDAERRDRLERVHEECPRAARRIEHAERVEWAILAGVGERSERAARDARDQRVRRVERAPASACLPRHEGFEGPPEHLGIDGRVGNLGRGLARGEAIPRQQVADHGGDGVVGETQSATSGLDGAALEESAVEERHATERECRPCAPVHGRVERTEAERVQQTVVQWRSAGESLHLVPQEGAVAIEPAFGLDECEKEQPRRGEQGDRAAIAGIGASLGGARERLHGGFEFTIEAPRERIPAEGLAPAQVHECRGVMRATVAEIRRRRQRRKGLRVRLPQLMPFHHQRGQCIARGGVRGGDQQFSARAVHRDDDPMQRGRASRHRACGRGDAVAQGGAGLPLEQQRPQGIAPRRDARVARSVLDAESCEVALEDAQRLGEAERGGERGERRLVTGRGEEARGIAGGEHARMVRSPARPIRITSSRAAPTHRAGPRTHAASTWGPPARVARG